MSANTNEIKTFLDLVLQEIKLWKEMNESEATIIAKLNSSDSRNKGFFASIFVKLLKKFIKISSSVRKEYQRFEHLGSIAESIVSNKIFQQNIYPKLKF